MNNFILIKKVVDPLPWEPKFWVYLGVTEYRTIETIKSDIEKTDGNNIVHVWDNEFFEFDTAKKFAAYQMVNYNTCIFYYDGKNAEFII